MAEKFVLKSVGQENITPVLPAEALMGVDYIFLAVMLFSMVVSLWRGFTKEAISLLTWIGALYAATKLTPAVTHLFESWIQTPSLQYLAAGASIFIGVLIIGGIINISVGRIIDIGGLKATDRFFGLFFGLARGLLIMVIVVLLCSATRVVDDPWWKKSQVIAKVEPLAVWLKAYFPDEVQEYFRLQKQMEKHPSE